MSRRHLLAAAAVAIAAGLVAPGLAADKIQLRLSSVNSETEQRAVALIARFGPAAADFASVESHRNGALFTHGTEFEAIARGTLEMSITSAQELAVVVPQFSIFPTGYVLNNADHQVIVVKTNLFYMSRKKAEGELGVKR